jgi:hypothetical protein
MNTFALLAFLCGAVLAFRFKVFVLYPLTGLIAICALASGIGMSASLVTIVLGFVAVAMALQVGYLFGGVVRGTMLATQVAARRREISQRRPQPVHDPVRFIP